MLGSFGKAGEPLSLGCLIWPWFYAVWTRCACWRPWPSAGVCRTVCRSARHNTRPRRFAAQWNKGTGLTMPVAALRDLRKECETVAVCRHGWAGGAASAASIFRCGLRGNDCALRINNRLILIVRASTCCVTAWQGIRLSLRRRHVIAQRQHQLPQLPLPDALVSLYRYGPIVADATTHPRPGSIAIVILVIADFGERDPRACRISRCKISFCGLNAAGIECCKIWAADVVAAI